MRDRLRTSPVSARRSARTRASSTCFARRSPSIDLTSPISRRDVDRAARHHGPGAEVCGRGDDGRATGGPRPVHRSPTHRCGRSSPPTTTRRSPSPGRPGRPIEMVKLFQLELEHYEKITGDRLSLEGKANRLAQMIRGELPAGDAGAGGRSTVRRFRPAPGEGRIFYYDATGGRWEEDDYQTTGSGGQPAKNSLKKRWRPGLPGTRRCAWRSRRSTTPPRTTSATGGPDPVRRHLPDALAVTARRARPTCPRTRSSRRGRGGAGRAECVRCSSCRTSRPSR